MPSQLEANKKKLAAEDELSEAQHQEIQPDVLALFQEDDDDGEEIKQLQLEIRSLATKAYSSRARGPALISSRLQQSLQDMRPHFSLPELDAVGPQAGASSQISVLDSDVPDPEKGDDATITQAALLKARMDALNAGMPALIQRMKRCLESVEQMQRASKKKPMPLSFL